MMTRARILLVDQFAPSADYFELSFGGIAIARWLASRQMAWTE